LQNYQSKDITVYVHGATANFYTSAAQAAQIRHFTGYNHLVLVFSWPTAENFLFYGSDVENALKSAPSLTRLLKFLALNTQAQHINILAYSAGGQAVSTGLALLANKMLAPSSGMAEKHLKLAEIYFAAPDIDLQNFVSYLPAYINRVNSVTIAYNPEDFVLGLASFHQGSIRLGRPEAAVLSEKQQRALTLASNEGKLNVIRIAPELLAAHNAGGHDFWFSHPWVSTDMLIQLLFHASPSERGLQASFDGNFKWWSFPVDYQDNIVGILNTLVRRADNVQN